MGRCVVGNLRTTRLSIHAETPLRFRHGGRVYYIGGRGWRPSHNKGFRSDFGGMAGRNVRPTVGAREAQLNW